MAQPQLKRVVSRWEVVALAINDVIGSGVYLLPAAATAALAGASPWAVLVAGIAVLLIVLCFAEAGSLFDEPGSAYVYSKAAFGDFVGWEVGWMTWIARVASVASLSAGFAQALAAVWPAAGAGAPRVIAIVALLAGLAALNIAGVKQGARASAVLAVAKVIPLLAFIAIGATAMNLSRLGSTTVPDAGVLGETVLLLLFAYAGFENTAAAAGEHRNPQRDVPFALLVQIGVVTLIYTVVQLVAVGVFPATVDPEASLSEPMQRIAGPAAAMLVAVGAVVSILGTNASTVLAGPRYLYAIAGTGALPRVLTRIHPRFHTPWIAILVMCAIALPLALSGTFAQLAKLSVIARLATYLGTAASVIVLRYGRMRDAPRAVRLPLGPAIPILAILVCLVFVTAAEWINLVAGAVALAIGALLWVLRRKA